MRSLLVVAALFVSTASFANSVNLNLSGRPATCSDERDTFENHNLGYNVANPVVTLNGDQLVLSATVNFYTCQFVNNDYSFVPSLPGAESAFFVRKFYLFSDYSYIAPVAAAIPSHAEVSMPLAQIYSKGALGDLAAGKDVTTRLYLNIGHSVTRSYSNNIGDYDLSVGHFDLDVTLGKEDGKTVVRNTAWK